MMPDFIDRAWRLFRGQDHPASRDVFKALAELQGVYAKSYLDLDNIESLFGAIEMAKLLGKLGDRSPDSIAALRDNLVSLIVETVEATTVFPTTATGAILPAEPYGNFVQMLKPYRRRGPLDSMSFSFLTFNYDIALDHALAYYQIPFDYCLAGSPPDGTIPLLKLHGSINWGVCRQCDEIRPLHMAELAETSKIPNEVVRLRLGTDVKKRTHHDQLLSGPLLVPPTWNKSEYHGDISRVWSQAAQELGEADLIFVIGYSLPPSDSFFRYLYSLGTTSNTRLQSFRVVNPDESDAFKNRFRDLLGQGRRNRVRYLSGKDGDFNTALPHIHKEIEKALKRD